MKKLSQSLWIDLTAGMSLLSVMTAMTLPQAFAEESMGEMRLNAQQKQQLLSGVGTEIKRHKSMSLKQIAESVRERASVARARLAAQAGTEDAEGTEKFLKAFDKSADNAVVEITRDHSKDGLSDSDFKDLFLAQENAKLQSLMTSSNGYYTITRAFVKDTFTKSRTTGCFDLGECIPNLLLPTSGNFADLAKGWYGECKKDSEKPSHEANAFVCGLAIAGSPLFGAFVAIGAAVDIAAFVVCAVIDTVALPFELIGAAVRGL